MKLTLNSKVQTRDGYPARIVAIDRKGSLPVLALIEFSKEEVAVFCDENGRTFNDVEHPNDLVPVPYTCYVRLDAAGRHTHVTRSVPSAGTLKNSGQFGERWVKMVEDPSWP